MQSEIINTNFHTFVYILMIVIEIIEIEIVLREF